MFAECHKSISIACCLFIQYDIIYDVIFIAIDTLLQVLVISQLCYYICIIVETSWIEQN